MKNPIDYSRPSLGSLPLQMLVYYNILFSLIYIVLMGTEGIHKARMYHNYAQVVTLIVWLLVEPLRLYYGYTGNLRESVPHLSTYLLMTIFPQLPIIIYLSYFQILRLPIDPIMGSLMIIFLIYLFYQAVESLFGWLTIRQVIKNQTAQFMQLVEHED